MNKDTISRKEVMKYLCEKNKDGMPIDAKGRIIYEFTENLIDEIRDNIPSVIDIDMEVKRLEEKIIKLMPLYPSDPMIRKTIKDLTKAIEILKEDA